MKGKIKIIAIANQKGGVGKTTTTMNLGYSLAKKGKKVLLIDFDPQHNLTNYLNTKNIKYTISQAIQDELNGEKTYINQLIHHYDNNLDYIPTTLDLSAMEMSLVTAIAQQYVLTDILEALKVNQKYNYVLIDCMPALNTLLINVLTASTSVLIPVEASEAAFEGLEQFFDYVTMVKKRLNKNLYVEGILYTKVTHTNMSKKIREKLNKDYPDLLIKNEIKELTEARESYANRIPLQEMKKSRLANDYMEVANEIINNYI